MFLFVFALALLVGLVQFGLVNIAFDKLGLSSESAYLLFIFTLIGSAINVPLFTMKSDFADPRPMLMRQRQWPVNLGPFPVGKTLVMINVGGAIIPIAFSLYLIGHSPLDTVHILMAVFFVALIAHLFSRPIPGLGVGIPLLIAPLAAAIVATALAPEQKAPLAYIGGTLGVLVGADLLRLKDIRKLGAPVASIGGAGSFDGVFITGLIAILLT